MDNSERLIAFIRAGKAQGIADDFVVALLKQNGWPERSILQAYSDYYGGVLGQPIPSRGSGIENARDAFFYLLAFITLGIWAFALGNLFYVLIDRMVNDPLSASTYAYEASRSNISFDIAAVIVAFPIFLWMTWIVQHQTLQRPEGLDSGVRKWLTYIALVVTASSLIGDAVWFLQEFLNGSLTQAFMLKSLVLVAIAGGIFLYYLGAVRAEAPTVRRDRVFAGVAIAAVLAGIAIGFAKNGPPYAQRQRGFDERRVQDLTQIAAVLQNRWQSGRSHALPANLSSEFAGSLLPLNDPVTHQPYEYQVIGGPRYRLCANFDTSDEQEPGTSPWRHTSGRVCFIRNATMATGQ